jgi:hypothetical protein
MPSSPANTIGARGACTPSETTRDPGRRATCAGALCLSLALALLALAGCGRIQNRPLATAPDVRMQLATVPDPPVVGTGTLRVTLADPQGTPLTGARLAVEADMTHAGMVPVFGQGSGGQAGTYTVPITWTMAGDWVVSIKAVLPDGRQAESQFPVRVAGRGS